MKKTVLVSMVVIVFSVSISAQVKSLKAEEAATLLRQAHFPNIVQYTDTGYVRGTLSNSDRPCWVGLTDINADINEVDITVINGRPYESSTKELQRFEIFIYASGSQEPPTRINSIDASKDLKIISQNGEKIQTLILKQQCGLVSSVTIQQTSQEVTCELISSNPKQPNSRSCPAQR